MYHNVGLTSFYPYGFYTPEEEAMYVALPHKHLKAIPQHLHGYAVCIIIIIAKESQIAGIVVVVPGHFKLSILAGPVQIAQLCHLYSVLEHNT